jgi:hypothetical protein
MSGLRYAFLTLTAIISISLLFALPAAQPSVATTSCILTGTQISPGDCIASAIPLALIGIMLSLIFGAIVFMFGEVLNYQALKGLYKRELWETAKSAIIVAIVFSSLVIASAIAASLTGTSSSASSSTGGTQLTSNLNGLYSAVNSSYLQPQLASSYNAFGAVLGLAIGTDLLRSVSLSVYFPIPIPTPLGIIGSVDSGVVTNIFVSSYISSLTTSATTGGPSLITITATYVTTVLVAFQFQSDLLYIIAAVGLGVFIPIGIFLRSIPFIRGIGGSMIAIGIGISLVYPALLLGFNLPVSNYMFSITAAAPPSQTCPFATSASSVICNLVWSPISQFFGLIISPAGIPLKFAFGNLPSGVFSGATALSVKGFSVGVGGPFTGGIFPALNFIIDNCLNQIVQFILFVFDIIIGYAITNGIANILGGKLTLGVGRFKLA